MVVGVEPTLRAERGVVFVAWEVHYVRHGRLFGEGEGEGREVVAQGEHGGHVELGPGVDAEEEDAVVEAVPVVVVEEVDV